MVWEVRKTEGVAGVREVKHFFRITDSHGGVRQEGFHEGVPDKGRE